jgi:uncharacterized membrane protein
MRSDARGEDTHFFSGRFSALGFNFDRGAYHPYSPARTVGRRMDMSDESEAEVEDESEDEVEDESEDSSLVESKPGTVLGIDQGAEAVLAVALTWVTGALFLVIESKNEYVRFHAFQAVILFLGLTVVGAVLGMIPFVGGLLGLATALVAIGLWILLLIKAWEGGKTGERFKIPIIGDITEANLKGLPKIF